MINGGIALDGINTITAKYGDFIEINVGSRGFIRSIETFSEGVKVDNIVLYKRDDSFIQFYLPRFDSDYDTIKINMGM